MPSSTELQAAPASSALRVVPRQARGRAKVARVLEAADRIVASEGAEAITTVRVAAEAGVSIGSLYRYLPHREAIIDSLAQHYLALLEERMDQLVEQASLLADDLDFVDTGVDAFADFYRRHPGFRALWFSRHLTEQTRELDRTHKLAMAHRLRALLVASGLGRNDKATLRISQTVQLTADALIQEAFRTDPRGDRALLQQLKILLRSYLDAVAG